MLHIIFKNVNMAAMVCKRPVKACHRHKCVDEIFLNDLEITKPRKAAKTTVISPRGSVIIAINPWCMWCMTESPPMWCS